MEYFETSIEVYGVGARLRGYLPEVSGRTRYRNNRPAVIVLPGGAYGGTYSGEAEPIALKFAAEGVCAFVLDYSCAPNRFPIPQLQAFKTVRFVRENAEKFAIDEHNICACGFSAGGHLCACTGTLWNKFDSYFQDANMADKDCKIYRPDKLILCYPVICAPDEPFASCFSFEQLLGERYNDEELRRFVSLEKQVDEQTPTAFLWHTSQDTGVSVGNTYSFALALTKKKINCETHVYYEGEHGLCLGTHVTNDCAFTERHEVSEWIEKAIRFVFR